jgi:hypothetical protein
MVKVKKEETGLNALSLGFPLPQGERVIMKGLYFICYSFFDIFLLSSQAQVVAK